jgi:hypothetical protein
LSSRNSTSCEVVLSSPVSVIAMLETSSCAWCGLGGSNSRLLSNSSFARPASWPITAVLTVNQSFGTMASPRHVKWHLDKVRNYFVRSTLLIMIRIE